MLKLFALGFLQTFFIAQQSRNYAQSRYMAAFITSVIVGVVWGYALKGLMVDDFPAYLIFTYAVGTGAGAIVGTLFHKRVMKKKNPSEW